MYGAVQLTQGGGSFRVGASLHRAQRARHEITADGVRLVLPDGPSLSDAEARRLAWAILADLAPDEVEPAAEVVTYTEAQRLAVLRAVRDGGVSAVVLSRRLGWNLRTVQKRLRELVSDGRLEALGAQFDRTYSLAEGARS